MASKANTDGKTTTRGRKASKKNTTESEIVLGLTLDQQRTKVLEAAVGLRKFDGTQFTDEQMLTEFGAVPVTFAGVRFHVKGYMPDAKNGQTPKVYALLVLGKGATFGMAKIAPFIAQLPPDSPLKLKGCAFLAWSAAGGQVTPEMGCEIAIPKGGRTAAPKEIGDTSNLLIF